MDNRLALRLKQFCQVSLVVIRCQVGHQVSEIASHLVEDLVKSLTTLRTP